MAMTAQINARIDAGLKQAGDRALMRAGYSTTSAIRTLWERFASLEDDPEGVQEIIEPVAATPDPADASRAQSLANARGGSQIFSSALEELGIPMVAPAEEIPYDELREGVLLERLEERGLGA